jgi:hypothetical protein
VQVEQLRKLHDKLVAEVDQRERELADLARRVADREMIDAKNAAEVKSADVRALARSGVGDRE